MESLCHISLKVSTMPCSQDQEYEGLLNCQLPWVCIFIVFNNCIAGMGGLLVILVPPVGREACGAHIGCRTPGAVESIDQPTGSALMLLIDQTLFSSISPTTTKMSSRADVWDGV